MKKKFFIIFVVLILIILAGIGFYMSKKEKINAVENKNSILNHVHNGVRINSEKDFLIQMIYHHQEAIDAAQKVLERGGTIEEVKEIAINIIANQQKEVELMRKWYKEWFNEDLPDQTVYHPMMRSMQNLSGRDLDKQFLEDMILHHQGAILMTQSLKKLTNKKELLNLIDQITSTQSKEIEKIHQILKNKFY